MNAQDFSVDNCICCHSLDTMDSVLDGQELMENFGISEEDQRKILIEIHGEGEIDEDGRPFYNNVGVTTEIEIIAANLGIKFMVYDEYHDKCFYICD